MTNLLIASCIFLVMAIAAFTAYGLHTGFQVFYEDDPNLFKERVSCFLAFVCVCGLIVLIYKQKKAAPMFPVEGEWPEAPSASSGEGDPVHAKGTPLR